MHKEKRILTVQRPSLYKETNIQFSSKPQIQQVNFRLTLTLIISDDQTLHVGNKFKGRNPFGVQSAQARGGWGGWRGGGEAGALEGEGGVGWDAREGKSASEFSFILCLSNAGDNL